MLFLSNMSPPKVWQTFRTWLERWRRPLRLLATLAGGFFILFFFWYIIQEFRASGYDLWDLLKQIGWSTLGILFLIYFVALVLAVWVWGNMMNQVATPLPSRTHWYIYTITNVTQRLPGSLWHVAGRTVLYHEHGIARRAVALVSALQIALMMMSGALVSLFLWPTIANHFEGQWQGVLLMGGTLLGGMILLHPASWQQFRKLSGGETEHAQAFSAKNRLTWLLAYSVVWIVGGLNVVFLANALYPLPLSVWPAIIAAWVLSSLLGLLIMILPSGLGVSELSLTLLLSFYMPTPLAALVAIANRFIYTLFELLFAVIFWLGYRY